MRTGARLLTRIRAMESSQRGRGCPLCGGLGAYCVLTKRGEGPKGCASCGRVRKVVMLYGPPGGEDDAGAKAAG